MTIDLDRVNVLKDNNTREVFQAVVKPRTVTVRELKSSFPGLNLEETIVNLKNAGLIKEQPAVINDFSTLYVTANGLSTARALAGLDFNKMNL